MRASYQICRVVKVQQSRTEFEWVWSLVFGRAGKSQMEKMNCHCAISSFNFNLESSFDSCSFHKVALSRRKILQCSLLDWHNFWTKADTYTFPSGKKNPLPSAEFSYSLHFIFMILHKLYSFGTFVSHMIVAFFTSLNCVLINQYFYLVIYSE